MQTHPSALPIGMRLYLYLALFLGAAGPAAAADPSWERLQLPEAAQKRNLRSVHFVDAENGWIVGDKGLCLATHDGGATWQIQKPGSKATLRCVQFVDAQNGWICGDSDKKAPKATSLGQAMHVTGNRPNRAGTLLHTTDGGKTWKTSWIPTTFEICCIETSLAPVLQVGVSGGWMHPDGDIVRSPDGGKTWKTRRALRALLAVRAVEGKRWVAVGWHGLQNMGWQGGDRALRELYDNKNVSCRALYSDDSGQTWHVSQGSEDSNGNAFDAYLRALGVGKSRPLLAVGDQGAILRSKDAGVHWEKVASPTNASLRGVTWCGPWAVAVGDEGVVLLGTDDGKSWRRLPGDLKQTLYGASAAGENVIAVGEEGTALIVKIAASAKR